MGTNGSSTAGPEGQGLFVKCNKFSQNQSILCLNDIALVDLAEITGAIAAQQGTTGDTDSPAGNLFTLRPGMTQSDFLVETPSLDLTYFRHFDDTYDNSIPVDPEGLSNSITVNATTLLKLLNDGLCDGFHDLGLVVKSASRVPRPATKSKSQSPSCNQSRSQSCK